MAEGLTNQRPEQFAALFKFPNGDLAGRVAPDLISCGERHDVHSGHRAVDDDRGGAHVDCRAAVFDYVSGGSRRYLAWPVDPTGRRLESGETTFCLRAGVHQLTSSIRPKTGNTFVGEYGAILDGTGWTTADDTQAAFRAHNEDIDYVTIRNLVIRNMPQRGIHAFYWMSDHWTIEYNEIASNKYGIVFAQRLHHQEQLHPPQRGHSRPAATCGGGYVAVAITRPSTATRSPITARNRRWCESANVTFRNNFVHHNAGDGIWYDSNNNAGALIEGNRVEDNGRTGIFFEISIGAIIRNNTSGAIRATRC